MHSCDNYNRLPQAGWGVKSKVQETAAGDETLAPGLGFFYVRTPQGSDNDPRPSSSRRLSGEHFVNSFKPAENGESSD